MKLDRHYTLMLVAENGARSWKLSIPRWVVRASLVAIPLTLVLLITLLVDYRYVVSQVFENRELQAENRRLRQSLQTYKNRTESMEAILERIQSFATRLRLMTNLENRENLSQILEKEPPDANQNLNWRDEDWSALPEFAGDTQAKDDKRQMDRVFQVLANRSMDLEASLHDLFELLSDQKNFLLAIPTKKPASGTPTSGFGVRYSPLGEGEKMHEGLDIANFIGTPIMASAQGTVTFAGRKPGYGLIVIVDHGYGLETWYGHTSRVLVKSGVAVKRGQKIALMGNSGHSTGPHLHYEIRAHGIPVDPVTYILED